MDHKLLSQDLIDELVKDMQTHPFDERNQLMDWLMANQLTKDKKTIALIQPWENSPFSLQRHTHWYYQARLRWTGQTPSENTSGLLSAIETSIDTEEPEVQWAVNFTAGWIGVYDKKYRTHWIEIGEKQAYIKVKWYQKVALPIICQSSLQ
jgi:hypothetical protein